jgi:hypothetical protein
VGRFLTCRFPGDHSGARASDDHPGSGGSANDGPHRIGRAFDHGRFSGRFSVDFSRRIQLPQLPRHDAIQCLLNEADRAGVKIGPAEAEAVVETIQGLPLALRLAVSLLEKEGPDADPRAWIDDIGLSSDRIQAALYDRVLLRIRDEDLRKVAMPGLLVRRLTAKVIREVLAAPCGLDPSEASARALMREAQREGQLFQRDPLDPEALWHRPDVRALMLPDLERCIAPAVAREINERAVAHYQRLEDPVSRAEELYHRLRLDQPNMTSSRAGRWTPESGSGRRSTSCRRGHRHICGCGSVVRPPHRSRIRSASSIPAIPASWKSAASRNGCSRATARSTKRATCSGRKGWTGWTGRWATSLPTC